MQWEFYPNQFFQESAKDLHEYKERKKMKYDIKKIYAINNADEVKVGMKGYAFNTLNSLHNTFQNASNTLRLPDEIVSINMDSASPFRIKEANASYVFFYPYEEPIIEYRPFKNVEEFLPFRDRWILLNGVTIKTNGYNECGTLIGNSGIIGSWERGFKELKFDDGTPFGVVK